jgi:DNA invertase Pin-like site-specific DNA recombinase
MGFWTPRRNRKLRVGIYVRVSTADQQTLPMQLDTIRKYMRTSKWKSVMEVDDIGSGAKDRKKRQQLMVAARRREIDAIVVWKLDRWGVLFTIWYQSSKNYPSSKLVLSR